MYDVDLENY